MLEKFKEFIKFSLVGGLMTILSLVLFGVLIELFHINYLISNVLSYTIAVIISYFLNAIFTFKENNIDKRSHVVKLIEYFIMKLALLGLDSLLLYIMVDLIHINVYFSKVFLTVLLFLLSYPFSKFIIKRRKLK